jgi:protein-tyrosine sulfotransferase
LAAEHRDTEGIVLLGAPRSGTTLLRRILDAHASIACPGETGLLRGAARFLETETSGVGVQMGVPAGLAHAGFSEADVVEATREFVFGFQREIARRAGKPRWMEKNAFDAFHVEGTERLCGEHVVYVLLVRHGLDTAASMAEFCDRSGSHPLDLHRYVVAHKIPLEGFTHAWSDAVRALLALRARRPDRCILVKYEDLVARSDDEVGRILDFLGEPREPGLVARALEDVGSVGLGDWKTYARAEVDVASRDRW